MTIEIIVRTGDRWKGQSISSAIVQMSSDECNLEERVRFIGKKRSAKRKSVRDDRRKEESEL
jgi:hypothetical protein